LSIVTREVPTVLLRRLVNTVKALQRVGRQTRTTRHDPVYGDA
jgi:hypothetical protein